MAVANFGISFGASLLSRSQWLGGLPGMFLITGGGLFLGLILLLTVKYPRRPEFYARQAEAAMVFDTSDPLSTASN